jgi:hypothetical protein
MSKPLCISPDLCLRPTFQEWYDGNCRHLLAKCGSYAEHGLGIVKFCDHPKGPSVGLRTITLKELSELDHELTDEVCYLASKAASVVESLPNLTRESSMFVCKVDPKKLEDGDI